MSADRSFDPRLQPYLDQELSTAERAALEADLAGNPDLAADLARLRAVNALARESLLPAMPRGFEARVLQAADRIVVQPWWAFLVPSGRRPFTLLAWGLSACTVLAVVPAPFNVLFPAKSEEAEPPPMAGSAADRVDAASSMPPPMSARAPSVTSWSMRSTAPAAGSPATPPPPSVATMDADAAPPAPRSARVAKGIAEAKPSGAVIGAVPVGDPLRAGETDDNQSFGKYLDYLRKYSPPAGAPWVDVRERYTIVVTDAQGRAVPDAEVRIPSAKFTARTDAGGQAVFFPNASGPQTPHSLEVGVDGAGSPVFTRRPEGDIWRLTTNRGQQDRLTLDVAFVLDTTGSMSEEIERLRETISDVSQRVGKLPNRPRLRLGLVMYRDRNESYVTQTRPFTESVDEFRGYLRDVRAEAGGDEPEDVNAALGAMVDELQWSPAPALRMAFLVGDAPPHLDYQETQYLPVTQRAAAKGIKICAVSTSGGSGDADDDLREYVWRQAALFTRGRFLFITKGGDAGTTVHHVERQDYTVTALPDLVVQCVARELGALGKAPSLPPTADLGAPLPSRPTARPTPPPPPVLHDEPERPALPNPRLVLIALALLANVAGWWYAWRRSRQPLSPPRPLPDDQRWQPPRD